MEIFWKLPTVVICSVLGSAILLSGAGLFFDDLLSTAGMLKVLIEPYMTAAIAFSDLASNDKYYRIVMALFHYFSLSILTAIIGELGYWSTFKRSHQTITRLVHFLLWPIAPLWHFRFYSIFKDYATKIWKNDHIPYKSVIWAFWASVGYFYMFWILTLASVIYLQ